MSDEKKRWSHQAKGKILRSGRGCIYVPYEMTSNGGWYATTVHDPDGHYPPGGYNICISPYDVEHDEEINLVVLDWAVFEYATGLVYHCTPATQENAEREAKLAGEGHVAKPLEVAMEMANAFAHGRHAGHAEAGN